MPESSKKVRRFLEIEECCWEYIQVKKCKDIENIEPIFERIK